MTCLFLQDKVKLNFLIFLLCFVTVLGTVVLRKSVADATRTSKCYLFVICTEDFKMSSQKSAGQGTRTPPTSVSMSTPHPTRIPKPVTSHSNTGVNVHVQGLETSQILSKANEVLYKTPNKIDPADSYSTQCTVPSRSNEQQGYYQPSTITTNPSINVHSTTTTSGSWSDISGSLTNPPTLGLPTLDPVTTDYPSWLPELFQRLGSRLSHIGNQLLSQNSRWQNMDRALQTQSISLQNQNARMLSIEQQMTEINGLKTVLLAWKLR